MLVWHWVAKKVSAEPKARSLGSFGMFTKNEDDEATATFVLVVANVIITQSLKLSLSVSSSFPDQK